MINTIISYHKAMKYYNLYEDPDLASDDSLKSNNLEDNLGQLSIVMRVLVLGHYWQQRICDLGQESCPQV